VDYLTEQVGLPHGQFCARHRVISQKVKATNWLNKRLTTAGFQVQIIALVRYIIIIIIIIVFVVVVVVDADPSGCTKSVGIRPLAC